MKLLQNLKQMYKTHKVISNLKKVEKFDDTFKYLVPSEGKADTVLGEINRAIHRIGYRWYNDGDVYFLGYGKETCGGDANYLSKCEIEGIKNLFKDATYGDFPTNKKRYEEFLDNLQKEFMKVLQDKNKVKELLKPNEVDSREMESIFDYMEGEDDDIIEQYIIVNTYTGGTLMTDDSFEDNWQKCCHEDAWRVQAFDSERDAWEYVENNIRWKTYDEETGKGEENDFYKEIDVDKVYFTELGNGIMGESLKELKNDIETALMNSFFG